jgi:hypothetical protein
MSDAATFAAVLAVKLLLELAGRWSENSYLTGRPTRAAFGTMLTAAAAIPIGRRVIAGDDNAAALAVVIAAGVATWVGCWDLARRRKRDQ